MKLEHIDKHATPDGGSMTGDEIQGWVRNFVSAGKGKPSSGTAAPMPDRHDKAVSDYHAKNDTVDKNNKNPFGRTKYMEEEPTQQRRTDDYRKFAPPINKTPSNPDYPTNKFDHGDWMKSSKKMEEESPEQSQRRADDYRKFAPAVNKTPSNPNYPTNKFSNDEWMATSKKMEEDSSEMPENGDTIRTRKSGMEGHVERVEGNEVFFRTGDGRLMKTGCNNAVVIQKLADGEKEMFEEQQKLDEISNEVLTKYKTAAATDARKADKEGDVQRGNKRFGGIVKATNKQFDNDAKARTAKSVVKELAQGRNPGGAGGAGDGFGDDLGDDYEDLLFTLAYSWWADGQDGHDAPFNSAEAERKLSLMGWKPEFGDDYIGVILTGKAGKGHRAYTIDELGGGEDVDEGSMGGINRSRPAQDVSYEKVLDRNPESAHSKVVGEDADLANVTAKWLEEQQLSELSVQKMQNYQAAASSPESFRTRPLRKLAKSSQAVSTVNNKIAQKRQGPAGPTTEDKSDSFSDILGKQHTDDQAAKPKPAVKDIPYHNWTIRYRPASEPGQTVSWQIMDKKHDIKHKGEAMSDKEAVTDAEEWIKQGGGSQQESSSNVTIDFNVDFAKEFAPGGSRFYATIDSDAGAPILIVSTEPQQGLKNSHIRTQQDKIRSGTNQLPTITMSAKEANAVGLQPNGRYLLGDKDPVDDQTAMFPLIYQGTVQGKGDMMRMGKPGLTVAHPRA